MYRSGEKKMPRPGRTSNYGSMLPPQKRKEPIKKHPNRKYIFCPVCGYLLNNNERCYICQKVSSEKLLREESNFNINIAKKKEQEKNSNITKSDFFENYLKSIPDYNNEGRKKTCYILWKGNTNFYLNLLKFLKFLEGNIRTPLDTTVRKLMEWILEAKPNADTNSRFPLDIISYLSTYGFIIRKNKFLYLTNLSRELLKTPTEKNVLIILMKAIVGFEFFLKCGKKEYSKTELMEFWTKNYNEAYKNNNSYKITNDDYLHKQFDRRIKWLIALKYIQKKEKKYLIIKDNWPNFRPMNREINMKKNRSNNDQTEPYLKKHAVPKKSYYIRSLLEAYEIYNSFKNIQPGKIDLNSLSNLYKYILANYKKEQHFPDFEIAGKYEGISHHGFKKPQNIAYGMLEFLEKIFLLKKIGRNYSLNEENKFTYYFLGNLDESSRFFEIFKEYLQEKIISIKFFRVLIQFLKTCNYGINSNIVDNLGTEMIYWTTEILKYNSLLKSPIKRLINTKIKNQGVKKPFNPVVVQIGLNILLELKIIQLVNKNYSINTDLLNLKRIQEIEKYDINKQHKIINSKKIPHHFEIILFEIINTNNSNNIFYYSKKNEFQFYLQNFEKLIHFNKIKYLNIESIEMQNLKRITTDFLKTQDFNNVIFTESQMILFKIVGPSFISGDFIIDFKIDKEINYFIKEFFSIFLNFNLKEDNHYHDKNESLNQLEIKKKFELEEFSIGNKEKDYATIENMLKKTNKGNFHCLCGRTYLSAQKTHILNHINFCTVFNERLELYINYNNDNNLNNIDLNKITLQYLEEQRFEIYNRQLLYDIFDYCGSKFSELIDKDFTSIIPAKIEIIKPRNKVNAMDIEQNTALKKTFNEPASIFNHTHSNQAQKVEEMDSRFFNYKITFNTPAKQLELLNDIIEAAINKPYITEYEIRTMCTTPPYRQGSRVDEYISYLIENNYFKTIEHMRFCYITKRGRDIFKKLKTNVYEKHELIALNFLPYLGYLNFLSETDLDYKAYFNGPTGLKKYFVDYNDKKREDIRIVFHHWDYKIGVITKRDREKAFNKTKFDYILKKISHKQLVFSEDIFYFNDYRDRNPIEKKKRFHKISLILNLIIAIKHSGGLSIENLLNQFYPFHNLNRALLFEIIESLNINGINICINEESDIIYTDNPMKFIITNKNTLTEIKEVYNFEKNREIENSIYPLLINNKIIDWGIDIEDYLKDNSKINFQIFDYGITPRNIKFENEEREPWNILSLLIDKPPEENNSLINLFFILSLKNEAEEEDLYDENDIFSNPRILLDEDLNENTLQIFNELIPYHGVIPLFNTNHNYYDWTEIGQIFSNLAENHGFNKITCAFFYYFIPHFRIFILLLDLIENNPQNFRLNYINTRLLYYNNIELDLFKIIEGFLTFYGYDIINEEYFENDEITDKIIENIRNLALSLNVIENQDNYVRRTEEFYKYYFGDRSFLMRRNNETKLNSLFITFLKKNIDKLKYI